MNKNILNTGIQSFIRNYYKGDILTVLLQKQHFEEVENKELVQQLESRHKCRFKLPLWYHTPLIYYPPKLAIEQSSSEITAAYKSNLISGNSLVDITGGFGVDSYFLSKSVGQLFYCEKQAELAEIARHNFSQLGASKIVVHQGDGIEFMEAQDRKFDWVFLDPSRRSQDDSRVFKLKDAEPALPECLEVLWNRSDRILIKTSPLLDISQGTEVLLNVKEVHVVAVQNEVKELIWVLERDFVDNVRIITVNINREQEEAYRFNKSDEKAAASKFAPPLKYVYEPNATILKAGAFKILGQDLDLLKLHEHSHLYTSEKLVDFPGRRYVIDRIMNYKPREFKKLGINKANIKTRNFPYTVQEIRKKFKIKDGGETTIFFTTDLDDQLIIIICGKI